MSDLATAAGAGGDGSDGGLDSIWDEELLRNMVSASLMLR